VANPLDLTDLATVKAQLVPEISGTGSDAVLSAIITAVSTWAQQWCGRTFMAQSYTENRNGNNRDSMRTKNYPLISVSSLTLNSQTVSATTGNIGAGWINDDKFIYLRQGLNTAGGGGGLWAPGIFTKGIKNVTIIYTAGFITPGQVAIGNLPGWTTNVAVVTGAQILVAGYYYTAQSGGVTGTSTPSFPATTGATVTDNTVTWICNGAFAEPPDGATYIPYDIQTACNFQVSYLFGRLPRIGDSSIGEGPARTTFVVRDAEPYVKDMLTPYKAVVPIGDYT